MGPSSASGDQPAGLLITADVDTESYNKLHFCTQDYGSATVAQRPKLIIDYVVPEPVTLTLLGIGGVLALLRRRRRA